MLNKFCHLAVTDQRICRSYIQGLLIFPFPDDSQRENAIKALSEGLRATLEEFPFLAGVLGPEDETGKLILSYPSVIPDVQSVFTFEILAQPDGDDSYSYDVLKEQGMPPCKFEGSRFAPRSLRDHPGVKSPDVEGIMSFRNNRAPPMGVGAIFIPGGLVLSTYVHHSVMDGYGLSTFWSRFAHNVRLRGKRNTRCIPEQWDCRTQVDERVPQLLPGQPIPAPDCLTGGRYEYTKTLPEGTQCEGRIFVLPAARLSKYREELNLQGIKTSSPITIFNIIAALTWIHVTRARKIHLGNATETNAAIAIDMRKRAYPPLENYTGNFALDSKATLPIDLFVSEERVTDKTIIPTIQHINNHISELDNAWVERQLAFLASLETITDTEKAVGFLFGPDVYMTSWLNFNAFAEFDIPGAGSTRAEFIRRTHSTVDGGIMILPRRREFIDGVEAPYEVVVRLACEDMKRVRDEEDGLEKRWAEKVI